MRRRRLLFHTAVFSVLIAASASAAGGSAVALPTAPIDSTDYASLQRGAATFVNYCSGCHSAVYMRYGQLAKDLGIPEDLLRSRLVYTDASLAEGMQTAMRTEDATEWFHQAAPPDLSLSAKLRGSDWLYAYLRGFYRDETRPSGWNNNVFANVAMPHVLADLQGEIGINSDGEYVVLRAGQLSSTQYDLLIADLVNFMHYMAEPTREARHRAGYIILSLLLVLLILTFFLYREYWRDIH